MKRALVVLFALAVLALNPARILAGTTGAYVTVTAVDQRNDGKFLLDISGSIQGSTCATTLNRVTGDATTSGGKAMLQVSMSAFLAGKRVYIDTTNTCSEYAGIDSIARIYIVSN
ncbi:MAG TPA: hypothetical protein VFA68_00860 [Terriglobales bacterium]|nr:hypothetical protein [Terriglobales bacterium]